MPDIIVTTPRDQSANAAREAAACRAAGGGEYFRRFPGRCAPVALRPGVRIWYVEDGYLRGYATVSRVCNHLAAQRCDTTGRQWPPGIYAFMDATSWRWIRPIPMRGFRGFRYLTQDVISNPAVLMDAGGWLAPRPGTPG